MKRVTQTSQAIQYMRLSPFLHELVLPDLGLGDQPIVAGMWLAEPGERVSAGEPLLEILAGSVVVDLPAPADGVLVEMLVDEDTPLQPGQRLAIIESEGDHERGR